MKLNLKSILNPTIWKVGLRIILGAFALAALIFTVALAGALYRDAHGRIEWRDVEISKNVEVRAFRDGVRVWNTKTGKYTTPKLRWVSCNTTENDSLNVICDKAGNRASATRTFTVANTAKAEAVKVQQKHRPSGQTLRLCISRRSMSNARG